MIILPSEKPFFFWWWTQTRGH